MPFEGLFSKVLPERRLARVCVVCCGGGNSAKTQKNTRNKGTKKSISASIEGTNKRTLTDDNDEKSGYGQQQERLGVAHKVVEDGACGDRKEHAQPADGGGHERGESNQHDDAEEVCGLSDARALAICCC